ncbi:hypothetical protein NVX19_003571 [Salmonella enterica]|nr:hypothetical protein [Salmonella enterica]
MQLSGKIQGFFGHVTMQFALMKGWDMEQELDEFYKTVDLTEEYASLSTGETITEGDIFAASCGEVTPSFAAFWNGITLKEDAPDDGVFMQSMHSGSSDYLFVKDVREIQEISKNVVA